MANPKHQKPQDVPLPDVVNGAVTHLGDRLSIGRLPSGAVLIRVHTKNDISEDITVEPNVWASLVATLCHAGENNFTFNRALLFHQGADLEPKLADSMRVK